MRGWDFVDADNNPWDYNDHGTHVAGTVAARGDHGIGVVGVAWQASVMPVRALNAAGSGSNANISDAFVYAADNGAKLISASLGGPLVSQAMSDAITNHPDTLFVVAAGNGGADGMGDDDETTATYPCNYTAANLICIAATTTTMRWGASPTGSRHHREPLLFFSDPSGSLTTVPSSWART